MIIKADKIMSNEIEGAMLYERLIKAEQQLNNERKIRKLQALINDSASTEGEKESCKNTIERLSK